MNSAVLRAMIYLPAIVILLALGTGAILYLTTQPTSNNMTTLAMVIGFLAPSITSLMTLLQSKDNQQQISSVQKEIVATKERVELTHNLVNSQTERLVAQAQLSARLEGIAEGIAQEQKKFEERLHLHLLEEKERIAATAEAAAKVLETAALKVQSENG